MNLKKQSSHGWTQMNTDLARGLAAGPLTQWVRQVSVCLFVFNDKVAGYVTAVRGCPRRSKPGFGGGYWSFPRPAGIFLLLPTNRRNRSRWERRVRPHPGPLPQERENSLLPHFKQGAIPHSYVGEQVRWLKKPAFSWSGSAPGDGRAPGISLSKFLTTH